MIPTTFWSCADHVQILTLICPLIAYSDWVCLFHCIANIITHNHGALTSEFCLRRPRWRSQRAKFGHNIQGLDHIFVGHFVRNQFTDEMKWRRNCCTIFFPRPTMAILLSAQRWYIDIVNGSDRKSALLRKYSSYLSGKWNLIGTMSGGYSTRRTQRREAALVLCYIYQSQVWRSEHRLWSSMYTGCSWSKLAYHTHLK